MPFVWANWQSLGATTSLVFEAHCSAAENPAEPGLNQRLPSCPVSHFPPLPQGCFPVAFGHSQWVLGWVCGPYPVVLSLNCVSRDPYRWAICCDGKETQVCQLAG